MAKELTSLIDIERNLKESETPPQRPKTAKNKGKGGITVGCPTVYLLPEEKDFIKKLEAHIMLMTGKIVRDHQLIMNAVYEYTKKHHSDYLNSKAQ